MEEGHFRQRMSKQTVKRTWFVRGELSPSITHGAQYAAGVESKNWNRNRARELGVSRNFWCGAAQVLSPPLFCPTPPARKTAACGLVGSRVITSSSSGAFSPGIIHRESTLWPPAAWPYAGTVCYFTNYRQYNLQGKRSCFTKKMVLERALSGQAT